MNQQEITDKLKNLPDTVLANLHKMTPQQISALFYGKTEMDATEKDKLEFTKKINHLHDNFEFTIEKYGINQLCGANGSRIILHCYENGGYKPINIVDFSAKAYDKKILEKYILDLKIIAGQYPHLSFILLFKEDFSYNGNHYPDILFLSDFAAKYKDISFTYQHKFTMYNMNIDLRDNFYMLTDNDHEKIEIFQYLQKYPEFLKELKIIPKI